MNFLQVAETFYSIQGEGPTMGVPSVFLRLSWCNLRCPGWGPPGSPQGCDTTDVWSKVWKRFEPKELVAYWTEKKWVERLRMGAHLILTGGEPLIWQRQLADFLFELQQANVTDYELPYIEVETNGTIEPMPALDVYVNQYNVSPKLKSAGNPLEKAYKPDVLRWFVQDQRAYFKFVVQDTVGDPLEIQKDYELALSIEPTRIYVMPEAATRERLLDRSLVVAEIAKQYGWNFSSRLQLICWDKATGV
jgi:7-carboxy-7-deazaguanine synthase